MTVLPFRRPLARQPARQPLQPPPALTSERRPAPGEGADDERVRMRQNLAALVLVILLLAAGYWLVQRLQAYSRALACIDSGHRSCLSLDAGGAR